MKLQNTKTLRDALNNAAHDVATTPEKQEYGKGVLVGIVATIMAITALSLDSAIIELIKIANDGRKITLHVKAVPDSWQAQLRSIIYDYHVLLGSLELKTRNLFHVSCNQAESMYSHGIITQDDYDLYRDVWLTSAFRFSVPEYEITQAHDNLKKRYRMK